MLMYWIRRRTGREDPTHTSHNQANFLAGFKRSLMAQVTVQRESLFQATQDSRPQVPAILTFKPAITLGSSIVDPIQIPPKQYPSLPLLTCKGSGHRSFYL